MRRVGAGRDCADIAAFCVVDVSTARPPPKFRPPLRARRAPGGAGAHTPFPRSPPPPPRAARPTSTTSSPFASPTSSPGKRAAAWARSSTATASSRALTRSALPSTSRLTGRRGSARPLCPPTRSICSGAPSSRTTTSSSSWISCPSTASWARSSKKMRSRKWDWERWRRKQQQTL